MSHRWGVERWARGRPDRADAGVRGLETQVRSMPGRGRGRNTGLEVGEFVVCLRRRKEAPWQAECRVARTVGGGGCIGCGKRSCFTLSWEVT